MKEYNVAVVGATGMVGEEMALILEERNFPIKKINFLASEKSVGKTIHFKGKGVPVNVLDKNSFRGIDVALFSAGGKVSKEYAPIAVKSGAVVIDNTSYFRMDEDVPLVVPEVNPEDIAQYKNRGIISNPNCSTIQMVVALKPIYDNFGIKRIVVATYQATSGAGKKAVDELIYETKAFFEFKLSDYKPVAFPHKIAFNCLPHIDVFLEDGYTKEEEKMVNETRKIFHNKNIKITATCARIPVIRSHSEAINVETKKVFDIEKLKQLIASQEGCKLLDNPDNSLYPLALDASGKDEVFVGRIRIDKSIKNGINMWVVSDNLRKGAALNAVQIAERLTEQYL